MSAATSLLAAAAPDRPPVAEQLAEVVSNLPVNEEYRHLVLGCGAPATAARPGQFFQLLCPQPPGEAPYLRRPMSLYGVDAERGEVEFLYKVTGAGTRGLATLAPGDRLDILGPLGVGFALSPTWRAVVAVGRGAGLATLAPLARAARANGTHVTAILSARQPDLLVSVERLRGDAADVITVTDAEATSGPAHVERLLRALIDRRRCDAFFTCGSSRLLRVMQRLGRAFAIPGQVALEQQMACGLGMCFCCVRDVTIHGALVHRRVCWDGPVFDLQEAVP